MNGLRFEDGSKQSAVQTRQPPLYVSVPTSESAPTVPGVPLPQGQRTDEQLMADYRQGDRQSFAELLRRYERELFHFLVRFLGDRAAAEDVFQETFLQIHQSADQFDPSRRFRPWL